MTVMECGHIANATNAEGKPACAVHNTIVLHENQDAVPNYFTCPYCKRNSNTPVAFASTDGTHYDGCRGWG